MVVHRYGFIESSVRAHQVPSGHIGHIGQSLVGSKNIKFGPKWVENRPFGLKQGPNEPNRLSGPILTTPEAKNSQKTDFTRKTAPRGPRRTSAAPLTPIGAGRGLRTLFPAMSRRPGLWALVWLLEAEVLSNRSKGLGQYKGFVVVS